MRYNKNIILEILQSNFEDEIETFIDCYVMDLEAYELLRLFEHTADYAELGSINEMHVLDFRVEREEDEEIIDGIFFVQASIEGYAYWEHEHIYLGSEDAEFEFHFSFLARRNQYYSFGMY